MKHLTVEDRERIMRSRALPRGFNIPRNFRPKSDNKSQPPSALAHFTAPSMKFGGGSLVGHSTSRPDRQNIPPVDVVTASQNPPDTLGNVGVSSNVLGNTAIGDDLAYSANASPMFPGSQVSSPFPRDGSFHKSLVPPNLNLSSPSIYRARSTSFMSLPSISPSSTGSPLLFPRQQVSMDNMQVLYQSQYQCSNQPSFCLDPQLGDMADLSLPSPPSTNSTQNYADTGNCIRRHSTSTMPVADVGKRSQGTDWVDLSPNEQTSRNVFELQAPQVQRNQTQTSRSIPQFPPSGIDEVATRTQTQGQARATTLPQARQPAPVFPAAPYATTATVDAESQQVGDSSFGPSITHWPSTVGGYLSPMELYQPQPQHSQRYQNQTFAEFYQAASQDGILWS